MKKVVVWLIMDNRTDKAKVINIFNFILDKEIEEVFSDYDSYFIYKTG
jgi:hypothetical protein